MSIKTLALARNAVTRGLLTLAPLACAVSFTIAAEAPRPLDARGRAHIPIGIANSLDSLKAFVEPEGSFSPGFATFGVYFYLHDGAKLFAPTMDGLERDHGLAPGGALIPWSQWSNGLFSVRSELCHVQRASPKGDVQVVAARVHITSTFDKILPAAALYVVVRPLGPAGGPIDSIAVSDDRRALLIDGHPAVISTIPASGAGVSASDTINDFATAGRTPDKKSASSPTGDCSAALRFNIAIEPGKTTTLSFLFPVLPGRRAARHQWDGKNPWAQLDDAIPNPPEGGILQPDPGLAFYQSLNPDDLFDEATAYWKDLVNRVTIQTPDQRWAEAFSAITGHLALCMNENAPDVAVANYNVFNRDGMYAASVFQKAARPDLAEKAIDYFLSHPFNGRTYPEADNPGQIMWVMGEHYRFTKDKAWLQRVYPSLQKLASMVRYYRTTPGPHWVAPDSLDFGDAAPKDKRQELKPGRCDGFHPEYTQCYDIAGLRQAAFLASAIGHNDDAAAWSKLADDLFTEYDRKFGSRLPKDYGSYCVLWPCRLYPLGSGKAFDSFKSVGPQKPSSWRYFPLATAHQGLLAGNRAAGYGTLGQHLDHEQMKSWYAFDEGGPSGAGGWRHVTSGRLRTTWPVSKHGNTEAGAAPAMPHGWAVAEMALFLRDSLAFEDDDRLILLAGIPADWFQSKTPIILENFPTHFGPLTLRYSATIESGKPIARLDLSGANPPKGFILRTPSADLPIAAPAQALRVPLNPEP